MAVPRCSRKCDCPSCVIGVGNFSGAATTVIPGFTEVSGNWELDGAGNLVVTGPAVIRFDTPHPDGITGGQNVRTTFTPTGTGVVRTRVLVSYIDGNNYLAAEVYINYTGCDYLRLYKVEGGVETQLGNEQLLWGIALNVEYTLRVCWDPANEYGYGGSASANLRAILSTSSFGRSYQNEIDGVSWAGGAYVGLGIPAGTTKFSSFIFNRMKSAEWPACPNCNFDNDPDCIIEGDDFGDADKTACLWNGGTVVSGQFVTTGYTKFLVHHPSNKSSMKVCVGIQPTDGLNVAVHINSLNSSNGLTVTYLTTPTTQRITIARNGVTIDSEEVTVAPGTVMKTLCICFSEGMIAASLNIPELCVDGLTYEVAGGIWAALSGSGTWDNFTVSKTYSDNDPEDENCGDCATCDPAPECNLCVSGTFPEFAKVKFPAGITDSIEPACSDFITVRMGTKGCAAVSGTHILQQSGGACEWVKGFPEPSCDPNVPALPHEWGRNPDGPLCCYSGGVVDFRMVDPTELNWDGGASPGTYRLRGFVAAAGAESAHLWETSLGVIKPDCSTFTNLPVPKVFHPSPDVMSCQIPDSPCYFTSLPPI